MKNIKLIIAALISFAALSCEKVETTTTNPETNPEDGLVTLTLSTGEATKTHIANGTEIHWDLGDKITVFTNEYYGLGTGSLGTNAFDDFTMDGEPNGSFVRFTGEIAKGSSIIWAVYPSSRVSSCNTDGTSLNVSIPSTQTATPGSFENGLNISIAKEQVTSDANINIGKFEPTASVTFKNICALLKFHVPSGITNINKVTISTDNNVVGEMTFDHSGDSAVLDEITKGSNSIAMTGTFAENTDYYFVLAPVAISELSIFVNTTDNKQYAATRTFSTPLQLNAGEYKSLGNLNLTNMPSFGVDFDIQDDNGYLNGTNVIFSFPSNKISNLNLTISKEGGIVVRTINVDGPVTLNEYNQYISSYADETDSTWPYLPKGTYTVSGTYDTEGGAASVNNITFEINTDPNFNVGSISAYTSYTKYTSGEPTAVDDANACDGASIYVNASNVSISDKILKNSNYIGLIKVEFATRPASNYGSANLDNGIAATLTNQQYGEYKSPSYIFDGKSIPFAGVSCDVTGIPYSLSKTSNDSINKWEGKGTGDVFSWTGSNGMVLGPLAGAITVEKSFWIPTSINVSVSTSGNITNGELRTKTGKITVGSTPITNTSAKAWKSASFNVSSQSAELTSTAQTVQINLSDATFSSMTVNSLTIQYAN